MGGAKARREHRGLSKTQVSGAAPALKPLHPKRVDYKLERDNNIKSSISVMRPSQSCETNQLVFFFVRQPIKELTARKYKSHRLLLEVILVKKGRKIVSLLNCRYNYDIL